MPHGKWDRGVLHPLSWTHREENGEKPNNLSSAHKRIHPYHKQLLVSGETDFTPAPSHGASSTMPPAEAKTTSRHLPSPGDIELCCLNAVFAEGSQGGSGTAQLSQPEAAGAVGKDRDQESYPGLFIHALSPSRGWQMPARSPGCWRPAPTSCPAQLQAPFQGKPVLLEPRFNHPAEAHYASRPSTPGTRVAGLGEQRVPSAE